MGGITSNAIYLASSLTAASNPSVVAAETAGPPVIATVSSPTAQPIPPLDRGYVILDVPALVRPANGPNLGELINTEIRHGAQRYVARGNMSPSWASDAIEGDVTATSERSSDAAQDLDQSVLAEHEARISLLKQRIASLRTSGNADAASLVHDLGIRLKRAEAARKLAMARIILTGKPAPACDKGNRPATCGETTAAALVESAPRHAPLVLAAARGTPRGRGRSVRLQKTASQHATAQRSPSLSAGIAISRTALRGVHLTQHVGRAAGTAKGWHASRTKYVMTSARSAGNRRLITSTAADRTSAYRLARARRLLSNARGKLMGIEAQPAISIKSVGLWQWEGSDKWSLANYHNRAI